MTDSTANKKGLFGKLLLPGFTDAGANVTFQPPNHLPEEDTYVHDTQASEDQPSEAVTDVHDNRSSRDALSEVATEVHDNRTSSEKLSEVATEIHDNRTSPSSGLVKAQLLLPEKNDSNNSVTASADTPDSNRNNAGRKQQQQQFRPDNNNEERNIKGFFPTTKPPKSPRHPIPKSPTLVRHHSPVSPPSVARRQAPARSLSTTVNIATTSLVPEMEASYEDSNKAPSQKNDNHEIEHNNENNAKEPEENQLIIKPQQKERELNNSNLKKLQETIEEDDKAESDVVSEVLSTASIMGTVINIGDMKDKMAQIDAMAAFIEQESPHIANSTLLEATNDMKEGLSLPMFTEASNNASKDQQRPSVLPRNNSIGNNSGGGKENFVYDLLNNPHHTSTAGTANATTSSAAFSAAIRRAGRKNHNDSSSLSAPATPRTPGAPPRVEDLLKSTLSPRSSVHFHPPASFMLRSPGSSARMRILRHTNKAITNTSNSNACLKPRFSQSIHRSISPRLASQDDDEEEHIIGSLNTDVNSSSESSNVVKLRTPQRINIERKRSLDDILQTASSMGLEPSTIAKDDDDEEEKEETAATASEEQVETCESIDNNNSEIEKLKKMLKSARMELKEKVESNRKLDEELCQCRAEIGRLKSVEQLPIAPNRSVLDDHTEDSDPSPDRTDDNETSLLEKKNSSNSSESKMFEESFINGSNSFCQERQVESERLEMIINTLEQANDTIRRLHGELYKGKSDCEHLAPVVSISDAIIHSIEKRTLPAEDGNHQAGENFVTEWQDLAPPLPPPLPNHSLHSPIVNNVLEQWTSDRALHDSLIRWMERVMTEGDLDAPPLTISSLDNQLQNDFTTYVLPLLLRRADIDVNVQTRIHRQTTYDLAVKVSQKAHAPPRRNQQKQPLLDDHDITNIDERVETSSVANSAVTEQIVNGGPKFQDNTNIGQHREHSEFGLPRCANAELDEALEHEQQQQNTIMGALGGALGGFLNRTKPTASPSRTSTPSPFPYSYSHDPHEQPYHRVVSAPPGRIGVTFVNFQGHAMVSDVAPNSPLSSWIFASDILIAIDEVPVSGMRVRDIIKVLTNRKDRQRALRVISSHAMNDSILNDSNLSEEPN